MATRSSADYDTITLRTIRAMEPPPPFTVLTADGVGGTYWSTISSPMAYVSGFTIFSLPSRQYIADASYNSMTFLAGTGVQFIPTGVNQTQLKGNLFSEIKVPGLSTISSGQNAIAFSTLRLSSLGNTVFTTNTSTNTLTYEIRYPFFKTSNANLPLNDAISTITFIGSNSMILSTNNQQVGNFTIGIGISSFTSTGLGSIGETASTITGIFASTLLSSCVTFANYSTGIISLSTFLGSNTSSFYASTSQISTSISRDISTFSTVASKFYENIYGSVSTLSTQLYNQMEPETIASTNSIFDQSFYITSNQTIVKNFVSILQDMSNYMKSQIMPSYLIRITGSNLVSTTVNVGSTILGSRSYISTNLGIETSTFSTLMTSTFKNFTMSTHIYIDILSSPKYTLYSSIQTAKGTSYDTLLSTCELSLSSFTKYLTSSSRVFLDYSPCYSFNTINNPNTSTNAYQVSTFLCYDNYLVPNAAFTDFMNPTDVYNRTMRFEISTGYLFSHSTKPYILRHFHSSIMYVDNSKARINVFNPLGGSVLPSRYTTDCDLNLYTTTMWTNYTPPTNAISLLIHNAQNWPV
jgi:hypothetical protein